MVPLIPVCICLFHIGMDGCALCENVVKLLLLSMYNKNKAGTKARVKSLSKQFRA